MTNYNNLVDAIADLRRKGYTEDFNLEDHCIACETRNIKFSPTEFEIDHAWRFDEDSDPANQSVLYAISTHDHSIKGILVNGYGIYSDSTTDEMISKLQIMGH